MARTSLFVALAALATACATTPRARVRDLDGNPLPPYALRDTAEPVYLMDCPEGHYLVVTDRAANLYSAQFGTTYWMLKPGLGGVCERIRTSKL